MHRRVWFLAAAVVAVLGLTGSAAAVTAGKSSSSNASSLHAAPFAKAWANTPRTPAARAAKKTMVFGLEQTVTGFNLGNADQNAFYAAIVAGTPVIRGTYIINNKGKYLLDMASKVKASKKSLTIWIKKNANWNWLGHKSTRSRRRTISTRGRSSRTRPATSRPRLATRTSLGPRPTARSG